MQTKTALIIDDELEFCLLMCRFFSGKNIDCFYVHTIEEGLEVLEQKRPQIIVLSLVGQINIEMLLRNNINSIKNYDPQIFVPNTKSSSLNTLSLSEEFDRIIKWIKDKLR